MRSLHHRTDAQSRFYAIYAASRSTLAGSEHQQSHVAQHGATLGLSWENLSGKIRRL
jgi:hypothetical protein